MQNWWLSLFCGVDIVCCLLMKSNAIINCVRWPISGPGDAAWKRPIWRTLLSPIVEAVSPWEEGRGGGGGVVGVQAAIKLLSSEWENQKSSQTFTRRILSQLLHTEYFRHFQLGTMMIPSVIAPPAFYPGLYRPAANLPLHQTLPNAFPTHSSFLVEDLLRISRPAAFINRTAPSTSASLPTDTTTVSFSAGSETCSPKTSVPSSKDPTFLKFGVSAILAPSPKTGE